MNSQPLVSIVIPVYNGAHFMREAIDSALAQTYDRCEVLVVNDGSTDGGATEAAVLAYGTRVRYIAKTNGGVASALNRGLKEMKGEYFSWLSHDDVFYPNKIEEEVRFMVSLPPGSIVYGGWEYIDESSRRLSATGGFAVEPAAFRATLLSRYPIHGCGTLIPKKCFQTTGAFNESLRTTNDYEMWFRLAKDFTFQWLPQRLLKSRRHEEQGIRTLSYHLEEVDALGLYFLENLSSRELAAAHPQRSLPEIYLSVARTQLNRRCFRTARNAFGLALRALPATSGGPRIRKLVISFKYGTYSVVGALFYRLRLAKRSVKKMISVLLK